MELLSNNEIELVSGAREQDSTNFAAGVAMGAAAGFLMGGPPGAIAGAISVGMHALLIGRAFK